MFPPWPVRRTATTLTPVGLPIGLGSLVGFMTNTNSAWFASLKQPPGNPPSWVFGPVWTVLYGLMGYASHLVVQVRDNNLNAVTSEHATDALGLYYAQLGLNLAWMPLFFTAKQPTLALANIVSLSGLVWYMTAKFSELPTSTNTTLLLAPYCAWLGYGGCGVYSNVSVVHQRWCGVPELEPPPGGWCGAADSRLPRARK